MPFTLKTQQEIITSIALNAKNKRLSQHLTQMGLATRSGVSLASLKRFEKTGQISLQSLVQLAIALGCVRDFERFFIDKSPVKSLFSPESPVKIRKRGIIK